MASKNRLGGQNTGRTYCDLIEEIKRRILVAETAKDSRLGMPDRFAYEFCYLQLRMISELIGLSCLLAHGDIIPDQLGSLSKEWSAGKIFKKLENIHQHFYPTAVKFQFRDPENDPRGPITGQLVADGFLKKKDLLKLYHRCGEALHRGALRKLALLHETNMSATELDEIRSYRFQIYGLLAGHWIALPGGEEHLYVILGGPEQAVSMVRAKTDRS